MNDGDDGVDEDEGGGDGAVCRSSLVREKGCSMAGI